jgi:hydrogenase maturation protease
MAAFAGINLAARVLCLGNDILADDALGLEVAVDLRDRLPPSAEVVSSMESGFRLLDHALDVPCLVVVDTIETREAEPGTIHVLREADLSNVPGSSPHYLGLLEILEVGRRLREPVAEDVTIVAVEAADCRTVGGTMHPAVRAAIPQVVDLVASLIDTD